MLELKWNCTFCHGLMGHLSNCLVDNFLAIRKMSGRHVYIGPIILISEGRLTCVGGLGQVESGMVMP